MHNLMKEVVVVGGAKGVGKTKIIESSQPYLSTYCIFSLGKYLQELSLTLHGKYFPLLDSAKKLQIRNQMEEVILRLCKRSNLILDMHFGEFEEEGYPCVVPKKLLRHITRLVLITAASEEILKRRILDTKPRITDEVNISVNVVGEKLHYENLCRSLQVNHIVLKNIDKQVTIKQFCRFIKS